MKIPIQASLVILVLAVVTSGQSGTAAFFSVSAAPGFTPREQSNQTAGDEPNYRRVGSFSGYLTLDDDPRERVQRWFDPEEIATLMAMPTMKRFKIMGAFVEVIGCKQNAKGMCDTRVNYTIYKPDGGIFATRLVSQREILWRKQTPNSPRSSSSKSRTGSQKQSGKRGVGTVSNQSWGLARMHFRFGKADPVGEYQVIAKVTDLNANISLELKLNFFLR